MTQRRTRLAVRVLILDHSPSESEMLRQLLDDPAIVVFASVATAEQAVQACSRSLPDIILVNHHAVGPDTRAAISHIMHAKPLPIVVISAVASSEDGTHAFRLQEAGALAVVTKPWRLDQIDRAHLLQTLKLMAEVKVVRRWRKPYAELPVAAVPAIGKRSIELVAIGASTGGPVVLKHILSRLPPGFPIPILIVQHITTGFVDGLARWLSLDSSIPVQMAVTGEVLRPGRAYLAPDEVHLRLAANGTLALDREAAVNGHRPAVSCLFRSVAERCGAGAIGILLTGMGKDGAGELKLMRDAGAVTIAQDEASSVVYGMPGEAIRCEAATHVMSPDEIAAALPALVAGPRRSKQ